MSIFDDIYKQKKAEIVDKSWFDKKAQEESQRQYLESLPTDVEVAAQPPMPTPGIRFEGGQLVPEAQPQAAESQYELDRQARETTVPTREAVERAEQYRKEKAPVLSPVVEKIGDAYVNIGQKLSRIAGFQTIGQAMRRYGQDIRTGLPSIADMEIVQQWLNTDEAKEIQEEVMKMGRTAWDELYQSMQTSTARIWKAPLSHLNRLGIESDWTNSIIDTLKVAIDQPYAAPGQAGTASEFIAQSLGSAIPTMLASMLSQILTGSPTWGPGISQGLLYSDQVYDEEIASGATHEEAMWSAGLTGVITGVIGGAQWKGFTRIGQQGTILSLMKAAQQKSMKRIAKTGGRFTYEILKGALKSSIQEAMQEATVVYSPHLTRGKEIDWAEAKSRIGRAGLGGAVAYFAAGPITSAIHLHKQTTVAHKLNQQFDDAMRLAVEQQFNIAQQADGAIDVNTASIHEQVYIPHFDGKLTAIRNVSENILASERGRGKRVEHLRELFTSIKEDYETIAPMIEQHPELLPELVQINEILPIYEKAIKALAKDPTQQTVRTVKEMTNTISELGKKYSERIPRGRIGKINEKKWFARKQEAIQSKHEQQIMARWADTRMKSLYKTWERSATDENAKAYMDELFQKYPPLTMEEVQQRAEQGDSIARLMLENQEYAGGANELFSVLRQVTEDQLPTFEALVARANAGDAEAQFLIETTRPAYEKAETVETARPAEDVAPADVATETEVQVPDRNTVEGDAKFRKDLQTKFHILARKMGMSTEQKRQFLKDLTGKETTRGMTAEDIHTAIELLLEQLPEQGKSPPTAAETATEILKTRKSKWQTDGLLPGQIRKGFRAFLDKTKRGIQSYWDGQLRMERFLEAVDGYKDGFLYNSIARPVDRSVINSMESTAARQRDFISFVRSLVGDKWDTLFTSGKQLIAPKTKYHPRLEVDPIERIAIYLYSKNENATNHLLYGNLADAADPEIALNKILDSVTETEKEIADYILQDLDQEYGELNEVSEAVLENPLDQVKSYFPIVLEGVSIDFHPDPLNNLLAILSREPYKFAPSFTKARIKGAKQPLNLNALDTYFQHISRVEQFTNVAPAIKKVMEITNDRNFRREFARTQGDNALRVLDTWLKDAARGTSAELNKWGEKALLGLRRNGIVYALAYNIPSVMRQTLSNFNAMAVHPAVASQYTRNIALLGLGQGKALESFVMSRSPMMRTRSADEMIAMMDRQATPEMKIKGKVPWSNRALSWIRFSDKWTTITAWKSFFDAAMDSETLIKQYGLDGSEQQAIQFADKMVARTQPMSQVTHLPDFFRGGAMERFLSTFQNQVNNNLNFWAHDILGELKAGKITPQMAAYRVLFSYVLPAQMFGVIARGRLPETWKEAGFDLMTYGLASPFLIGRILANAMAGRYGQGGIETAAFQNAGQAIAKLGKGEFGKAGKYGLRSVGALTGRFPAQFLRSGEGAYNLWTGESDDWRELIWSAYALQSPKTDDKPAARYTLPPRPTLPPRQLPKRRRQQ